MVKADILKTVIVNLFGLFEFLRMPFGLHNAAQTFQDFTDGVLHSLAFMFVNVDDILVKEIRWFPLPKSLNQYYRFLDMINIYHRFLPNSAPVIFLLTELSKSSKTNFSFPTAAVTTIEKVKILLTDCSALAYQEPEVTLTLSTDASQVAAGAVLEQRKGDVIEPLALFLHQINAHLNTLQDFQERAFGDLQGGDTFPISPRRSEIHVPHQSQAIDICSPSQF
ncbi:unnamed protein product [Hymenolepis diminuta]|uniref:Reverse transcriptase/retrotransposon-derived protein RNase H-like domain-containing protein n=1 Tax=Hymenolepis diminuta TaxID=6216 RepID=A0A564ZDC9_HYMDI|nr:unnamed protein product [Hymenolepis diminuta]